MFPFLNNKKKKKLKLLFKMIIKRIYKIKKKKIKRILLYDLKSTKFFFISNLLYYVTL